MPEPSHVPQWRTHLNITPLTERAWEKEKKALYPVLTGTFEVDIDITIKEEERERTLVMKRVKKWESNTRLNKHKIRESGDEEVPDNVGEGLSGGIRTYDAHKDYNEGMRDGDEQGEKSVTPEQGTSPEKQYQSGRAVVCGKCRETMKVLKEAMADQEKKMNGVIQKMKKNIQEEVSR